MRYHRLCANEREEISRLLVSGCSLRNIGQFLGRNVSTISHEVHVEGCNRTTYRAMRVQKRARRTARRRKLGKRKMVLQPRLRRYVHATLRLHWSPEEIAHRIIARYPIDESVEK